MGFIQVTAGACVCVHASVRAQLFYKFTCTLMLQIVRKGGGVALNHRDAALTHVAARVLAACSFFPPLFPCSLSLLLSFTHTHTQFGVKSGGEQEEEEEH